jgi:hypothetical protein
MSGFAHIEVRPNGDVVLVETFSGVSGGGGTGGGSGTVDESDISLYDVTTDNATTSRHGFLRKLLGDSTKYLDSTGAWTVPPLGITGVSEANISLSDVTTDDVTITRHGFAPKAPNDTTKFLRGDGTWATVAVSSASTLGTDSLWNAKGDLAVGLTDNSAQILAVGATNGYLLAVDSTQTLGVKWTPPAVTAPSIGSNELVYRYKVTGSDKTSIDTGVDTADAGSNDWTNGDLLEIWISARTDDAGATSTLSLTVNNDGGANYDNQTVTGTNTTASASNSVAQTNWAAICHGSGGTANYAGAIRISIPNFSGTTFFKVAEMNTLRLDGTAGNNTAQSRGGGWRSTSAITRFAVSAAGGQKLKVGSEILIYKRLAS